MASKLKQIETFGTKWVTDMIKHAENAYKTELTNLDTQEKTLVAAQKNPAMLKKYNDQRTVIQTEAQKLKVNWHNADKKRDDAETALEKLAGDATSTKKQLDGAKKELEAAELVTLDALKAWNRKLREGNKLDLTELRKVISTVKAAQAILATFKTYNSGFKMPSAK